MPNDFRRFFTRAAVLATALFPPFGMILSGSEQAISVLSVAITSYTLGRQVGDLFAPLVSANQERTFRDTQDGRYPAAGHGGDRCHASFQRRALGKRFFLL